MELEWLMRNRMLLTVLGAIAIVGHVGAVVAQPAETEEQRIMRLEKDKVKQGPGIIGGSAAAQGEIPWQAGILERGDHSLVLCGGSFITPNIVLTAGHCVDKKVGLAREYVVVSGSAKIGDPRMVTHDITDIALHPRYKRLPTGGLDYDFALIRVTQKFTGQTIGIATTAENDRVTVGQVVRVSGWGRIVSLGDSTLDLQKLDINVVSRTDCNDENSHKGVITSRMLCASYPGGTRSACHGDSGGPLTAPVGPGGSQRLIGVVSWGNPLCTVKEKHAVFGRIHAVRGWIQSTTSQFQSPD